MRSLFNRPKPLLASIMMAGTLAVTSQPAAAERATAIFAGGCFWCVESDFDKVPGVISTTSGYIGGTVDNPTYRQVTAGGTGHYEAVEIIFDPKKVSYDTLLTVFWHSVDPTDAGGQFCDRGDSYRTAIFTTTPDQKAAADASKADAQKSLGKSIVTPILEAPPFYKAEPYHQDFYRKNPVRYTFYRINCGRDQRVRSIWGDKAYKGLDDKSS